LQVLSSLNSLIPSACAECDDSLPFSGASSIPLCYVLFPATLLHQLFVHSLSPHLAIYFLLYLSNLLFPNYTQYPFGNSISFHSLSPFTIPSTNSTSLLPSWFTIAALPDPNPHPAVCLYTPFPR
jgi:hypothetical protein